MQKLKEIKIGSKWPGINSTPQGFQDKALKWFFSAGLHETKNICVSVIAFCCSSNDILIQWPKKCYFLTQFPAPIPQDLQSIHLFHKYPTNIFINMSYPCNTINCSIFHGCWGYKRNFTVEIVGGGATFSGVLFWMKKQPKQEMTGMLEEPIDNKERQLKSKHKSIVHQ